MLYSVFIGIYNSLFLGCSRILSNYTVRNLFRKYIMAASDLFLLQHSSRIDVTIGDVNIDGAPSSALPAEKDNIDMVVMGYGDFISGTYQQDTADVATVKSNVTVDSTKLLHIAYAGLGALPAGSGCTLTANYGAAVIASGDNLVVNNKDDVIPKSGGAAVDIGDETDWFVDHSIYAGTDTNVYDGGLKHTNNRMGAFLIEAVSAALFKKYGRTAAILNDADIKGKQTDLAGKIKTALDEANKNYADSIIFKRYLDSGRYYHDGNGDVDAAHAYEFDNAQFDFVVQVTGNVKDKNSEGNFVSLTGTQIDTILGSGANDHKVSKEVGKVGNYTLNILLRLKQIDDLA